jgi:anti-sigma regulatory factor (Ser/Thr protein kinase)
MTASRASEIRSQPGFVHAAMIIDSDQTLRRVLVPELRRSLQVGEPVFLVVSEHTAAVVRDDLGPGSASLEWGDRSVFYQRLGFAYEAFRRYLAEQQARGRGVHVVAEPDFPGELGSDAPVDRAMAYLEYESICNDTYAPYGSSVTCLWDSRRHASHVIDGACSVHSHELTEAGRTLNPRYVVPEDYLAGRTDAPLQPPPAAVERDLELIEAKGLGLLRAAFGSWVEQHGFDVSAVEDIVLAITEVATNGLAHGAAPVRVRGWQDGSALVVQVDDGGGRPVPPDAGYRRPAAAHTPGGRGLWLARQLADTVTARAETGQTSVRLHFPREVHQPKPAVTGGGRRWAGSPTDRPAAGRSRPGHDPEDEPFLELRDYGTLPGLRSARSWRAGSRGRQPAQAPAHRHHDHLHR